MNKLPDCIKQKGYIATKNGDHYEVEYISGGHIPSEDYVELTVDEMAKVYNDHTLWDKIILIAKKRMDKV